MQSAFGLVVVFAALSWAGCSAGRVVARDPETSVSNVLREWVEDKHFPGAQYVVVDALRGFRTVV
jgi:hypothetical protein